MAKYRVIKTRLGFMVQTEFIEIKFAWFRRKEFKSWELLNSNGTMLISDIDRLPTPPDFLRKPHVFRTEKRAKKFIKSLKKKNKKADKFEDYEKKLAEAERKGGAYQPVVDNTGPPPKGSSIFLIDENGTFYKTFRIREGKEKANIKTVTSPRPKVRPSPQKYTNEGYQPTDELNTSNPPNGEPVIDPDLVIHRNPVMIKENKEFPTIPKVSKSERVRTPPKPPLNRCIIEGVGHFCIICGSSSQRIGFLTLFGERLCINEKCDNSNPRYR